MWPVGGSIVHLGTFGGPSGVAFAVNDSGQVVGTADLDIQIQGIYAARAALWEGGVAHDLGTAGGQYSSTAVGINASGLIVGQSFTLQNYDEGHATLWDHRSIVDLTALLAPQVPSNYRLTDALRINNKRNILLAGINTSNGNNIYYLATAVSPTRVSLTSSENPSRAGDAVMFVARVTADSGNPPNASVTFKDGGTVLGTSLWTRKVAPPCECLHSL
jgi:probable HAF family extracellular repeat protein